MQVLLTLLLLSSVSCSPEPDSFLVSDDVRDDIEGAARDSAKLADDLAGMLERLEDGVYDGENNEEERRQAKSLVSLELEEALKITEELAAKARGGKPSRRQKSRKSSRLDDERSLRRNQESRRGKSNDGPGLDSILSKFGLSFTEDDLKRIGGVRSKGRSGDTADRDNTDSRQEERGGRQFDFDIDSIDDFLNDAFDEESNFKISSGTSEGEANKQNLEAREGRTGYGGEEESEETCEIEQRENQVQVCVPSYKSRSSRVQFPGQEPRPTEKWCYYTHKTVCEEKEETEPEVEVCSFNYVQGSHTAAAVTVEMVLQLRSEQMGVTQCQHKKTSYGELEELCTLVPVHQHYKMPSVHAQDLELLGMLYPEPEDQCITYKTVLPRVECHEEEYEECIGNTVLAPTRLSVQVSHAAPDRECDRRDLTQDQEVCTKTVMQKRPAYPAYGQGYSG